MSDLIFSLLVKISFKKHLHRGRGKFGASFHEENEGHMIIFIKRLTVY